MDLDGRLRVVAPRLRHEIAQLGDGLDDLPFGEQRAELVSRAALDRGHLALDHLRRHPPARARERDQTFGLR